MKAVGFHSGHIIRVDLTLQHQINAVCYMKRQKASVGSSGNKGQRGKDTADLNYPCVLMESNSVFKAVFNCPGVVQVLIFRMFSMCWT